MFLLYDPDDNYKSFKTESDGVAAAIGAIEKYRQECYRVGEWDEGVESVSVYQIPHGVTAEDCADYGISKCGAKLLWISVESGNDESGYDYKLKRRAEVSK